MTTPCTESVAQLWLLLIVCISSNTIIECYVILQTRHFQPSSSSSNTIIECCVILWTRHFQPSSSIYSIAFTHHARCIPSKDHLRLPPHGREAQQKRSLRGLVMLTPPFKWQLSYPAKHAENLQLQSWDSKCHLEYTTQSSYVSDILSLIASIGKFVFLGQFVHFGAWHLSLHKRCECLRKQPSAMTSQNFARNARQNKDNAPQPLLQDPGASTSCSVLITIFTTMHSTLMLPLWFFIFKSPGWWRVG